MNMKAARHIQGTAKVFNGYRTRVCGEIGAQNDGEMYIDITF